MARSPMFPLRMSSELRAKIDKSRGKEPFSPWMREAAVQRLQAERGLGRSFKEALLGHNLQLRGLGTNLNQLARTANEGRPVVVDPELMREILIEIRLSKTLLSEIRKLMP